MLKDKYLKSGNIKKNKIIGHLRREKKREKRDEKQKIDIENINNDSPKHKILGHIRREKKRENRYLYQEKSNMEINEYNKLNTGLFENASVMPGKYIKNNFL
tara:strand:- start:601 stop:906 length:306 start_codon:yes stop_codon:yes gene_type:complete